MKRISTLILLILLLSVTLPLPGAQTPAAPRNVILMIGDGMGLAHVVLARLSLPHDAQRLKMDSMAYTAFVKTYSANSTVTDSAAAGTALATGHKTNNGMVGVLPDGTPVRSIREAAAKLGKATGLATLTTITHATPASFGAHVAKRGDEADIAPQLLQNKIDVLLGGGRQVFLPRFAEGSKRKDDRDLLSEAKSKGYALLETRDALLSARSTRTLGLFEMGAMTTESPEPTLAEMTQKAIELLSRDKEGFFLMVEGGQIDWKAHANEAPGVVKQVLGFDAAIGKALEFARRRGDTLVIVTADHETGGLTILGSEEGGTEVTASFATKDHTAVNVPLFADGPGAHYFHGVLDNTDVPKRIAQLWKVKGF